MRERNKGWFCYSSQCNGERVKIGKKKKNANACPRCGEARYKVRRSKPFTARK